jgi:hypothetical protein
MLLRLHHQQHCTRTKSSKSAIIHSFSVDIYDSKHVNLLRGREAKYWKYSKHQLRALAV